MGGSIDSVMVGVKPGDSRCHSSYAKAISLMGEKVSDGGALGKSIATSITVPWCSIERQLSRQSHHLDGVRR